MFSINSCHYSLKVDKEVRGSHYILSSPTVAKKYSTKFISSRSPMSKSFQSPLSFGKLMLCLFPKDDKYLALMLIDKLLSR